MSDPFTNFRFLVTLAPGDAYLPPLQAALLLQFFGGAFQEIKGLGADLEVTAYPEGGTSDFGHHSPMRNTWRGLVLRRGLVLEPGLWSWFQAGLHQSLVARRDGAIWLLDDDGIPAISWVFRGGIAVKWTGP